MEENTKVALWIIGIVIGIISIAAIASNSSKTSKTNYNSNYSSSTYTTKTTTTPKVEVKTTPTPITWHCIDATSFDKNPYNDNKCTSSTGEVRYVSDSQARALDSSYIPGTSGHPYYNSK